MIGLWYPYLLTPFPTSPSISKERKYPNILGLPNSLLKAAAPIGASNIICNGLAILSGVFSSISQGSLRLGILKLDTENPDNPALGLAPTPVAPSSLISPPEPVAAPGKGEIAVG